MPRTPSLMRPHIEGILNALEDTVIPTQGLTLKAMGYPVGEWIRPREDDSLDEEYLRLVKPPFVNARIFPSAGDFEGPINDSQADVKVRVQVQTVAISSIQAVQVHDFTREILANKANVTVTGRRVQNLKLMVVSGGVSRDNDINPPVFYDFDIYELWTTPEF